MLCGLALLLPSAYANAQAQTVTTQLIMNSEKRIGSQYRGDVATAFSAAEKHESEQARDLLRPVLDFCDRLGTAGVDIISVASIAEYDHYMATAGLGQPTDWIDIACPSAYKAAAFLYVDAKQTEEALRFLDKASKLAPYWAEPLAERGYLFNTTGRAKEALDAYKKGLDLVEEFPSNSKSRGLMLRGIGYAYVELGDLDSAEKAYRDSLVADPDSDIARSELQFIAGMRAKK
ncbi:MAG: tetratricopeptide repeat protein [Luteimonas sp.]